MIKHILFTNEEDNYIIITDFIRESFIKAKDYNDLQNADDAYLKFVTIDRQGYRCYICGEDGKRLNLAYLTTYKTTTDLNDVIGICPDCFEIYSKNGVIIDAFVMSDLICDNEKCKSFNFLNKHLPNFIMETDWIENELVNYEKQYGENEVIKALSISIDAYYREKLPSVEDLLRYTRGILRNAFTDGVKVNSKLYAEYDLSRWDI